MAGSTTDQKVEAENGGDTETRRDFLLISTVSVGAVGAAIAAWPFIDLMNPSADVLALASTEIDLSSIEEGQSITAMWRGKPVFIRRRTSEEIKAASNVEMMDLKDPEQDAARVQKPEWLVMIGVCTHLGCVPLDNAGEYGGWFCPCHGSHYDISGRIRKGPAPKNLEVPVAQFVDDGIIKLG